MVFEEALDDTPFPMLFVEVAAVNGKTGRESFVGVEKWVDHYHAFFHVALANEADCLTEVRLLVAQVALGQRGFLFVVQ